MVIFSLLLSIFSYLFIISNSVSTDEHRDVEDMIYFPQSIPVYPVRKDVLTNEEVSRGRIKDMLLGGRGKSREDELRGLRKNSAML